MESYRKLGHRVHSLTPAILFQFLSVNTSCWRVMKTFQPHFFQSTHSLSPAWCRPQETATSVFWQAIRPLHIRLSSFFYKGKRGPRCLNGDHPVMAMYYKLFQELWNRFSSSLFLSLASWCQSSLYFGCQILGPCPIASPFLSKANQVIHQNTGPHSPIS